MTKSALDLRKIRMDQLHDKEERAKDRKLKQEEGRKDRIQKYVQTAVGSKGLSGVVKDGAKAVMSLFNDPAWYKNYLKDLNAYVHLPTYDRLGSTRFGGRYTNEMDQRYDGAVPGIMVLRYLPMIGNQEANLLAASRFSANVGLARFKEKVLALNSRSSVNWEPSDLGLNLWCSADIMMVILALRRVILVYNTYHSKNAYLARALIEALGWDYDDVVANIADYRKLYVRAAKRFNTAIVAPKDISLFARRAFLTSNVFIDTDDKTDPRQIYVYSQDHVFLLNEVGDGADLTTISYISGIATLSGMLDLMMERIIDNPDYIEMYQDLRHAVGDNIIQIPEEILGLTIEFNNDPLNREQIHNFKTIYHAWNNSNQALEEPTFNVSYFNLRQTSDGYLYQGPSGYTTRRFIYGNQLMRFVDFEDYVDPVIGKALLNMHKSDVSGDDILDVTRWCFTGTMTNLTSSWVLDIYSVGTELGLSVTVHRYLRDNSGNIMLYRNRYGTYCGFNIPQGIKDVTLYLSFMAAFDWAPMSIAQVEWAIEDVDKRLTQAHFDANTTFMISSNDITALNEACVLSEVFLPDVGYRS